MPSPRLMVVTLALTLAACGGRAGPASGLPDAAVPGDGGACPSPEPDEGASCAYDATATCQYYRPGPCPGGIDFCRCLNGAWHCVGQMYDGGSCGAPVDAGHVGPLPAFCAGSTPHLNANGIESHPAVTGTMLPLNCCEAAELVVVTQTVPWQLVPIVVTWRAQVGQATIPATIDLANPPAGWAVQVYVGCDPAQGGCNPAPDSYTSGFTGSLQVTRTAAGDYEMSLCLAVEEPADGPHPLLHSLELWAPKVSSGYWYRAPAGAGAGAAR